ncbi:DUF6150 family protein [Pontibacter sp. SGAir0037]|uniref:DUF6150 family protein n=1 Tax=Pontibacter sp. SGAir0037 TaxID=2571030 RepID=UPI0010CCC3A0|nr:DUF6150 family protein [Pontibacter sp. SGAir0037]QCR24370.1 hypothetical protein C1N53_19735 [Pontibacter sp. SGAir0037]
MLIYITILLKLITFFDVSALESTDKPVVAEQDYCKIYGAVYLERDPKYKNSAAYTVFLGEEEAFANLVVFKENNKLFADVTGTWYITPNKAFADHVLFVTENRNLAQFTVHFTQVRSLAGCRE